MLSSEEMHRLQRVADPSADAIVEQIVNLGLIAAVNRSLLRWESNSMAPPSDLPGFVRDWLIENARLPAWADPLELERAHQLFRRHGPMIGLVGLTSSFAWMYACPHGAGVMAHSGRFNDQTGRRLAETIQYIFSVANPEAFTASGKGICLSTKVRLIHATVRWMLRDKGVGGEDGRVPISQLELTSTALSLGPKLIDDLGKLNVEVSAVEADAWAHLWRVCGALLGGDPAQHPADHAQGLALVNVVLELEKGPSEAGRELIRRLLAFFSSVLPGRAFDGIPAAVIRHLLDDERCEFIGVPRSRWELLFNSGLSGGVWSWTKSLPGGSSSAVERLSLALIEAHFREIDGVPVQLELPPDVLTQFQRRAASIVIKAHEDALADAQISEQERASMLVLQAQLQLSDEQFRRMALVGAVNAALSDDLVTPVELELIHDFAERAGMAREPRDELDRIFADGVRDPSERARLDELLQVVG